MVKELLGAILCGNFLKKAVKLNYILNFTHKMSKVRKNLNYCATLENYYYIHIEILY